MFVGLGMSLVSKLRSGVAVAPIPASLFASGEQGAWYEPSPTTCFTDTAGTIPAAVGDAVARINDLSGNGHHATQATAAALPTLQQTAGGLYYLDFDGVDDWMTLGTQSFLNGGDLFLSAGLKKLSDDINRFFEIGPAFDAAGQVTARWSRSATAGHEYAILGVRNSANDVKVAEGNDTTAAPVSGVVTAILDDSTATAIVRQNGSAGTPVALGAVAITTQEIRIGRGEHHMFGLVFTNDELTPTEISGIETYLAAKSGVTL